MEDALVQSRWGHTCFVHWGLNPCFNGRCTRTPNQRSFWRKQDCLNPCFNGRCTRTGILSILLVS